MTYAVFFEFERDDDLAQLIFIPATPLGGTVVPPTVATRVHPKGKRRTWTVAHTPNFRLSAGPLDPAATAVAHEINQFESISSYMQSYISDPSWVLRDSFPVDVMHSDLLELKDAGTKVPNGLNVRINKLREEKGLSV